MLQLNSFDVFNIPELAHLSFNLTVTLLGAETRPSLPQVATHVENVNRAFCTGFPEAPAHLLDEEPFTVGRAPHQDAVDIGQVVALRHHADRYEAAIIGCLPELRYIQHLLLQGHLVMHYVCCKVVIDSQALGEQLNVSHARHEDNAFPIPAAVKQIKEVKVLCHVPHVEPLLYHKVLLDYIANISLVEQCAALLQHGVLRSFIRVCELAPCEAQLFCKLVVSHLREHLQLLSDVPRNVTD